MYTMEVSWDGIYLTRPDGCKLVLWQRWDGDWRYTFVRADGTSPLWGADTSVDFLA